MFAIGNVVRSPYDKSLLIVGPNQCLIPFNAFNSTTHPPEEDAYISQETYDEHGEPNGVENVLCMYAMDKYEYVAATIEQLIIDRIKSILYT